MITFNLVEGAPTKQFETAVEQEMLKPLSHFEKELTKLRTGRAHASMVEDIRVTAYGSMMPLKELSAISAPEPQMLTIQPWDKSVIGEIEKAIALSDLGVTPVNDGNLIRIVLPKMSSSRRDELAKNLAKRLEECRVSIRAVRQDFHNLLRDAEKGKKISEDYSKRLQALLQKTTDAMIEKAKVASDKKEAELKSL